MFAISYFAPSYFAGGYFGTGSALPPGETRGYGRRNSFLRLRQWLEKIQQEEEQVAEVSAPLLAAGLGYFEDKLLASPGIKPEQLTRSDYWKIRNSISVEEDDEEVLTLLL